MRVGLALLVILALTYFLGGQSWSGLPEAIVAWGTIILAFATFQLGRITREQETIRRNDEMARERRENDRQLLDEIIKWATGIRKCGSEIDFLCLAARIDEQPWGNINLPVIHANLRDVEQKSEYIAGVATFLQLPETGISNLVRLLKLYSSETERLFISLKLGVEPGPLDDMLKPLVKLSEENSLVAPASSLVEDAVKPKTGLFQEGHKELK